MRVDDEIKGPRTLHRNLKAAQGVEACSSLDATSTPDRAAHPLGVNPREARDDDSTYYEEQYCVELTAYPSWRVPPARRP